MSGSIDGDSSADDNRLFLDVMLGKLAVYLRACGYDTAFAGDRGIEADDRILSVAEAEGRMLLTRDRGLAERADDGILLTERDVEAQLEELRAAGMKLELDDVPSHCGRCNGRLVAVGGNEETPEYAPDSAQFDCYRCVDCGQHFWKGSHWKRMKETLESG